MGTKPSAAELLESLERKIGRRIGPAAPPPSETLSEFRNRHHSPEPTACFQAGSDTLQEGDSSKLTEFRRRHVVAPDMPTSGRRDVLQEESAERVTPAAADDHLPDFRRRHLVRP